MDLNFTNVQRTFRCIALLFLLTLPSAGLLMAQTKFSTVVNPENPGLNGYVQVDYVIENANSIEKFSPPVFKDFELVQGPSQSTSVRIINGDMSKSQTYSYTLRAQKAGKRTIPGALAIIDGETMRSNAVTIEVDKEAKSRPAPPPRQQPSLFPAIPDDMPDFTPRVSETYRLAPGEDAAAKIAKNLFVKLEVNKTRCYVGEPIIATYKLYSRLRSDSRVTKRPSLNGFSVYDMKVPAAERVTVEQVNGQDFHVQILRRIQLLPLQSGHYTLEPVEIGSNVEFLRMGENAGNNRPRSNNPMQRMIDEFFGRHQDGIPEEHSAVSKSEPVTVQVMALPTENKPAGFNGAVGTFSMNASLKKDAYTAGDVAQLSVTIKGKGNLPMINPPQLHLPEGMETFDPSVADTINKAVYPLSGEKLIDYTFLLNKQGDYTIPPFSFSYFDPAARTYKTIHSDTFTVHVAENSRLAALKDNNKNPATTGVLSRWTDVIRVEMIAGAAIILLLLGIIVYLLKRNQTRHPLPEETVSSLPDPEKPETKELTDPLADVRIALAESSNQEFYSGINRAIREAVYERTASSAAHLTSINMPFILRGKGVPEETIAMVESLMKKCEIALYTPIHQERDKIALLEKAEAIIKSLQVDEAVLTVR